MAVTRLERKGRKNKTVAKKRKSSIKRLCAIPVIKNVDIKALKAEIMQKNNEASIKTENENISSPEKENISSDENETSIKNENVSSPEEENVSSDE